MKMKFISQRNIVSLCYSSNMAAANTLYIYIGYWPSVRSRWPPTDQVQRGQYPAILTEQAGPIKDLLLIWIYCELSTPETWGRLSTSIQRFDFWDRLGS